MTNIAINGADVLDRRLAELVKDNPHKEDKVPTGEEIFDRRMADLMRRHPPKA